MLGLRPVVEIMTINFSLIAIDQIVNHAAKMHAMFGGQVNVPMVIRTPGGGGQQLAATHSQNLEVWYAHIPASRSSHRRRRRTRRHCSPLRSATTTR